jgi:hypothetical protein
MDPRLLRRGKIFLHMKLTIPPRDKIQNEWSFACLLSMYFLGVERDFTLPQYISSIVFGAVLRSLTQSKAKIITKYYYHPALFTQIIPLQVTSESRHIV